MQPRQAKGMSFQPNLNRTPTGLGMMRQVSYTGQSEAIPAPSEAYSEQGGDNDDNFPFNFNSEIHGGINQNATDNILYTDLYSPQNEINSNCYFQINLGRQEQLIKLAKDILMIYGDSILCDSLIEVNNFYQIQNSTNMTMLNPNLFSVRFKAIFTYAQRILRPIWDMNITQKSN